MAGKDLICAWKERRKYEIMEDGQMIAQLFWPKPFGSDAIGKSAEGEWEIKRKGYFRYQYSVLNKNSQFLEGTFVRSWDTLLTLSRGDMYKLDRSFLLPTHTWLTSDNTPIIRFFLRGLYYIIRVEDEALKTGDLSLLAILGLYIIREESGWFILGT